MKVRDWLNNNSAVVTLLAVVVLVISLGVIIMNSTSSQRSRIVDMYYYDMNTGKLFIGKSDALPPIEAPSGPINNSPAGVRAYVFACGDCPADIDGASEEELKEMNVFIGWLEKYSEQAKAALAKQQEDPAADVDYFMAIEQGQHVSAPGSNRWVGANSEAGFRLMERISQLCGSTGEIPKPCYPGR